MHKLKNLYQNKHSFIPFPTNFLNCLCFMKISLADISKLLWEAYRKICGRAGREHKRDRKSVSEHWADPATLANQKY